MRFPNNRHVYRYVPNCKVVEGGEPIYNRRLPKDEQVVAKLSIITGPEDEALQRAAFLEMKKYSPDKAQELSEKRFAAKAAEHFHGVENLEVEGVDPKLFETWEGFCENAPRDIRDEVILALRSREMLTDGEQKNFLPESDGL
jgi:hypothetical protein